MFSGQFLASYKTHFGEEHWRELFYPHSILQVALWLGFERMAPEWKARGVLLRAIWKQWRQTQSLPDGLSLACFSLPLSPLPTPHLIPSLSFSLGFLLAGMASWPFSLLYYTLQDAIDHSRDFWGNWTTPHAAWLFPGLGRKSALSQQADSATHSLPSISSRRRFHGPSGYQNPQMLKFLV